MTTSLALRQAAGALDAASGTLADRSESLTHDGDALLWAGLSGDASLVASRNLQHYARQLEPEAQQMRLAAGLLHTYAELHARLEDLEGRAVLALGGAAATPLLVALRGIGDGLDWACARSIDALCTGTLPEPPQWLGDFEDLSVDSIHELNLVTSSDFVQELARSNPDIRLLEISEGRMVAIVPPPGEQVSTEPASVTTFIEGVGSAEPEKWQRTIDRTRQIAQATGGPVIAWAGYAAPPGLAHGVHAEPAQRAGRDLSRFQRSLRQRYPEARQTAVGYSYGSVVAGSAATQPEGLAADDLVLLGSPGAVAESARDYHLHGDDPQVHALTAKGDPIDAVASPWGGIHGPDPTSRGFGASPWPDPVYGDHGSYFSDSRFFAHLGDIARGKAGGS